VAVKVHGADDREIITYALLDQAREASFIHTNLAKKLNLKGSRGTLLVKSLTGTISIETEKVNVVTSIKKAVFVEDKKAEKMMEESAVIVDGHYEIGMLWKTEDSQLPNN
jgi:hypothetical protein